MLLSLNWIKEYVDLPSNVDAEKLSHDLTMATVEVEDIVDQKSQYDNIVIGVIKEIKNHPDADKLKLAMTDIGGKVVQIVCGGSNIIEGMKVVVALPGSRVRWHGEGDLVELAETKIRNEKSFGMICAGAEIDLANRYPSEDEKEIVDLADLETKAGIPLAEALDLNDMIIEIDNKSLTNRPDLWCHYGIARELAAIYGVDLKPCDLGDLEFVTDKDLQINIEHENGYRYIGMKVSGIEVGPSPEWMQQRLSTVGIRSINNIVDLTNYIMMDSGEPMHAFDRDKISSEIKVRLAKAGEKLELLGGETVELTAKDLVIADKKNPIALAGIKGGELSSVTDSTTEIVFEAAVFNPLSIRRTATRFEQRTDASARHEKGIDTDRAEVAMQILVGLLNKVQPKANIESIVDTNTQLTQKTEVTLSRDFIISRLGQDLSVEEIKSILERLQFIVTVSESNDVFTVISPTWRSTGDVSIPEDIVEEVARIYGYDNLKRFTPVVALEEAVMQVDKNRVRSIKEFMATAAGLHEIYNYPWTTNKIIKSLGIDESKMIEIASPPADDQRFLQTTLVSNLIKTVENNSKNFSEFGIFELARIFDKTNPSKFSSDGENLPYQPQRLAGAVAGASEEEVYARVKGICETLFKHFYIPVDFGKSNKLPSYVDTSKSVSIVGADDYYGFVGFLKTKSVEQAVCFFEINLSEIQELITERENKFKPLAQFPSIERDIAIEVDSSVQWQDIKNLVIDMSTLLTSVELFDIYKGKHISEGKKSVAFRMTFVSPERTLESAEVEVIEKEVIKKLEKKLQAVLRT